MPPFERRPTPWIMGLTSADRQSHPMYGIMGGTWPKANPRFVLPSEIRRSEIGTREQVAEIVEEYKLSQPFLIGPSSGGVCLLDDDNGTLCGQHFEHSTTMNRHMYQQHTAQVVPYTTGKRGPHAKEANLLSERGLYKFVLDGGWKDAIFAVEPGNPEDTRIVQTAAWLEELAETDENFPVARYGTKFLRRWDSPTPRPIPQPPASLKRTRKSRRDSDDENDAPAKKRGGAVRRGRRGTAAR